MATTATVFKEWLEIYLEQIDRYSIEIFGDDDQQQEGADVHQKEGDDNDNGEDGQNDYERGGDPAPDKDATQSGMSGSSYNTIDW